MNDKSTARRRSLNDGILKVMSIFSSLQVVNMLCSIVKQKFVAIWLTASGIGLFGIFQTVIDTIATLTDIGIRQSSIRDVSQRRGDPGRLAQIVSSIRSWNIVAGLTGALAIALFSPLLSRWIFGGYSRWWMFAVLGITMLINSLISGENAILQGLGRFKAIARVSLITSFGGLALSIPMFRWLGDSSVVLSFVVYALCGLGAVAWLRYRSPEGGKPSRSSLREGKGFVKLGLYMSFAAFASSLAQTVFIAWLNRRAGTDTVGYYQAGHTLVIRYAGFVISAIGMEFYPRLSAHIHSRMRHRLFVSHEITLLLLVLTPMLLLFILCRPLLIRVLYTEEFMVALPFITIAITQAVFRSAASCIAFSIIAKGDGKAYVFTEGTDAAFGICVCMVMYLWQGLTGIAWAYLIWYGSYLLLVAIVCRRRYGLRVSGDAWLSIGCSTLVCCVAAAASWWLPLWASAVFIAVCVVLYLLRLKRFLGRGRGRLGARRRLQDGGNP